MVPPWTVTLTYLGYAAVLLVGAACWLAVLFDHVVYGRVEMGLLDSRWLEWGRLAARQVKPAIWLGLACGGVAFLLAALPAAKAGPAVQSQVLQSHKAYQLKGGAILLCFLGLIWLTHGRMGAFDVDVAAVAVFAWGTWVAAAGWRAAAGGLAVTGPGGWWLALAADGLAVAAFAVLMVLLEVQGFRLF